MSYESLLDDIIQRIRELFPSATIPFVFDYGSFVGSVDGTQRIYFKSSFDSPPSVVCTGNVKLGELKLPSFFSHKFSLPLIQMPNIQIPTWQPVDVRQQLVDDTKSALGDWTAAFNWMRDAIAWAVGQAAGGTINFIYNLSTAPQRDAWNNMVKEINTSISSVSSEAIRVANESITGFNVATAQAQSALEESIKKTYSVLGLQYASFLTFGNVIKVTNTYFECQTRSGGVYNWISVVKI